MYIYIHICKKIDIGKTDKSHFVYICMCVHTHVCLLYILAKN